jgi:hypothetical protein
LSNSPPWSARNHFGFLPLENICLNPAMTDFDDLLINGTTDKYLLNVTMAMSKYLLSGLYFCRLDTSAKSVFHKKIYSLRNDSISLK